ncbi:type VI secretion system Vgr family protein [Chondromyces apiculatus]|uniref:VgrG protein n=1 Tax=Chondromyces apiculatus DSM 436 TaxID=1192034 RepID=A0A017THN4_9BACT|nr:type VI secretion system tip protein TssI/VgrG [Chondromyces apiculatus]EYF08793.1 VgrG protein [Chondromyces apiculatus DSM 436]
MADASGLSRPNLHLDVPVQESFDVREFTVDDGLSTLFTVDLEIACPNPALDLELVGQPASFHIELDALAYPGQSKRSWSGVISELHLLRSESTGLSTYRISLAPRLWLLTLRTNCRVFQQLTDLDIVKAILGEWGIEPVVECTRSYKTRKYRVQYQESDFTFICRMLEAAGITFYFRAADGESQLVLADTPEHGPEREGNLDYLDEPMEGATFATQLRASRALTSGKVTLADHDHRLPNTPLTAQASPSAHPVESQLENYAYTPGSFRFGNPGPKDTPTADDRGRTRTDPKEGQRIADQVGAASVARAKRFIFDSNALDLAPGLRFSIGQHPLAERVGQMLVTRTTFTGTFDSEAHVLCNAAAASTPYRPEAVTPTPVIHGVESAIVVGPAGETIHCDEFGRVRVQFHWDRYGKMDENSSCWVPVNQAWAGEGLGALNIPRIGQEVLVSFLAGNPEEPAIVGRIFTNLLRPPFPLPANKTQNGFRSASVPANGGTASGGFNMMMFEDKQGSEEIRIRAEKDQNTRVNNDKTLSVGRHRKMDVVGNDKEKVEGNQTNSVFGTMKSAVGVDKLASVVGDFLSMTGGQRVLQTIGSYVSNALSHNISSEEGTTISVGSSMIHIGPDSITIQTPKLLLNPGADTAQQTQLTGEAPSTESEA